MEHQEDVAEVENPEFGVGSYNELSKNIGGNSKEEDCCVFTVENTAEKRDNCYLRNEEEDMEECLEITEDGIGDTVLDSVEHVRDNAVTTINTLGQAENEYKANYPSSLPIWSLLENGL